MARAANIKSEEAIKKPKLFSIIVLSTAIVASLIYISHTVRYQGMLYVQNTLTFGFSIPNIILISALVAVTGGSFYFGLHKSQPAAVVLFLSGGWSNAVEKVIFGSVTDYIPLFDSYINIADIMIWAGVIWLNIGLWFLPQNSVINAKLPRITGVVSDSPQSVSVEIPSKETDTRD
jgi:lipoprotein signal peptidase